MKKIVFNLRSHIKHFSLRTGSYTEKTSEKVTLDDVYTDELVVFLSYVCPEGFEFDRTINRNFFFVFKNEAQSIFSEQNITPLVYFSDRLIFPWVKQEIKKYFKSGNSLSQTNVTKLLKISDDFKNELYDAESLIQLCYLLHTQCYALVKRFPVKGKNQYSYSSGDIDPIFKKIARLENISLVDKAVAAISDANMRSYFAERIIHFRPVSIGLGFYVIFEKILIHVQKIKLNSKQVTKI